MKKCTICLVEKQLEDFSKCAKSPDGRGSYCKICHAEYTRKWTADNKDRVKANRKAYDIENADKVKLQRKEYRAGHKDYFDQKRKEHVAENPEKYVLYEARKRALKFGLLCTITEDDIVIPEFCPIFGLKLVRGKTDKNRDASPSLDRIFPDKGYVPGNVAIISYRANRIKNNGTADELRLIADWMDAQKETP